jgi:hypothetical protein
MNTLGKRPRREVRELNQKIDLFVHKDLLEGHLDRGMSFREATKKAFEETLAIPHKLRREIFDTRNKELRRRRLC